MKRLVVCVLLLAACLGAKPRAATLISDKEWAAAQDAKDTELSALRERLAAAEKLNKERGDRIRDIATILASCDWVDATMLLDRLSKQTKESLAG